jgi:N-carbamoylputrescine amidase
MPNKKYKIAVIQLNLNDIAENNLKNASVVCDAAKPVRSDLPELYSSHYFVSEDVDNFVSLYST